MLRSSSPSVDMPSIVFESVVRRPALPDNAEVRAKLAAAREKVGACAAARARATPAKDGQREGAGGGDEGGDDGARPG